MGNGYFDLWWPILVCDGVCAELQEKINLLGAWGSGTVYDDDYNDDDNGMVIQIGCSTRFSDGCRLKMWIILIFHLEILELFRNFTILIFHSRQLFCLQVSNILSSVLLFVLRTRKIKGPSYSKGVLCLPSPPGIQTAKYKYLAFNQGGVGCAFPVQKHQRVFLISDPESLKHPSPLPNWQWNWLAKPVGCYIHKKKSRQSCGCLLCPQICKNFTSIYTFPHLQICL